MKGEILVFAGMVLIFTGFLLVFLGTLMSASEAEVEGGGVIMIGPIPIVFGTGRAPALLMILAVLLMVFWIIGALLGRGEP